MYMENIDNFKSFDYNTLPNSWCGIFIGSRRSGKSCCTNYLIQQIQKSNNPFTHVFLISNTNAGYEGIPKGFRYDNLDIINNIVDKQKLIKQYNSNNKEQIESKILLVLDDMASGNDLRGSGILNYLFLNGRHVSGGTNSLSVILTSQSLTAIDRKIRLNSDIISFNSLSSRTESEKILDECFFVLSTARDDVRHARNIYHSLVISKAYRFIVVCNFISNKRALEDYIFTNDALIIKDFKFFNNAPKKKTYTFKTAN